MKSIVSATDFSRTSNNAVKYAAGIANISGAKLIIYNVYDIYMPITTYDVMPLPYVDYRKHSYNKLRNLQLRMKRLYPKLNIEMAHNEGQPSEQISAFVDNKKPDMLIIGANSATALERLIGSTTSAMIRKSEVPVLAIPSGAKFKPVRNILFAYDLNEISEEAVKWIKQMALLFSAKIDVLCLVNDMVFFEKRVHEEQAKIAKKLDGLHPDVYFAESANFASGIERYVQKHKAGLVITQHRRHGFLFRMVKGSISKDLSFSLPVPLFSIPESLKTENSPKAKQNLKSKVANTVA